MPATCYRRESPLLFAADHPKAQPFFWVGLVGFAKFFSLFLFPEFKYEACKYEKDTCFPIGCDTMMIND